MNPNLKHITKNNGNNIADLKIYYDVSTDQYKVRHRCEQCNLDLGCHCYESIDDAIYGCNEIDWVCQKHLLEEVWADYELAEEIDRVCGTNLVKAVMEAEDYESEATRAITDSITEEQAHQILNAADLDIEEYVGEACRI